MQCYNRDTIKIKQSEILDKIYKNFDDVPVRDSLNKEYDETVNQLVALLGEDVPCYEVDCDLWSTFSDIWKDRNGTRPYGSYSRQYVKDWLFSQRERSSLNELI